MVENMGHNFRVVPRPLFLAPKRCKAKESNLDLSVCCHQERAIQVRVIMHTHQVSALGAQLVLEPLKGPNPFVNTSTILSPFEKVRLWCFGILLVPIRCLVVAGAFLACACASYVATMGEKQEDLQRQSEHPRPRWRQAAASAVPVCARMYVGARACLDLVPPFPPRAIWFLGLPVCRRMVWGLGFVSIRTKGRPVSAREAPVIVANHMGMIEAAYLVHVYGASVVTTVENAKVPLLGAIVRAMRCVTVDRAAGSGMDAIKARILTPGTQTLIFPEGKWSVGCHDPCNTGW